MSCFPVLRRNRTASFRRCHTTSNECEVGKVKRSVPFSLNLTSARMAAARFKLGPFWRRILYEGSVRGYYCRSVGPNKTLLDKDVLGANNLYGETVNVEIEGSLSRAIYFTRHHHWAGTNRLVGLRFLPKPSAQRFQLVPAASRAYDTWDDCVFRFINLKSP